MRKGDFDKYLDNHREPSPTGFPDDDLDKSNLLRIMFSQEEIDACLQKKSQNVTSADEDFQALLQKDNAV